MMVKSKKNVKEEKNSAKKEAKKGKEAAENKEKKATKDQHKEENKDAKENTKISEEQVEEKKKEKSDSEKLAEMEDKYLRLVAEYDNYRKRTLKEKSELIKTAGEDVLVNILPVVDDFDRAVESIDKSKDLEAVKKGIHLIHNKFKEYLKQKGVKEIEAKEKEFNTDEHEALTKIPAPDDKLKGRVVDVIEKGYYLNDKVIRFAKVVVGE